MRLFVNHKTEYRFSMPQRRLIQLLRVTPASHVGQQVIDWRIDVDRDASLLSSRDGYGNETSTLFLDGPVDSLTLTVTGEVLTDNRNGMVEGAAETLPPMLYLRPTGLTEATAEIATFAQDIAASENDDIARLHRLMTEIHSHVRFDPDTTHVHRNAGDAFAEGSGVCQDHAHIFLAAARTIDLPARYVSGHLWRRDGAEFQPAAHAWAEAWIEALGWVGFDPANGICPDDAYIRVAIGLDYRDAAPVSGARTGGGTESLAVGVTVSQAQTQAQN